MLAIAWQITGNLEDAQDVAQESFLRLYRSRDRFQEERSFEAWMYRIVVNQARRTLVRRKRRSASSLDDEGAAQVADLSSVPADEAAAAGSLTARLMPLLDELSPRLRSVFVLRDLQGMETAEIARILGCTETTVRRHSADARTRIRILLEQRYPGILGPSR